MSSYLFLNGYYSYWDEKEYTDQQSKEEQCGFLTAAYEVMCSCYKEHSVFSNLGICVIPKLVKTRDTE